MGYINPEANCGFLYVTDRNAAHIDSIVDHFRQETGISHWTGTAGMGICATGKEYHDTPAIAAMIGAFPDDSFRTLPPVTKAGDVRPPQLDRWLDPASAYFGILHGDPGNNEIARIIEELSEQIPNSYFVGGLSSSHGQCPQVSDQVAFGGLSGILFSEKVPVATALTQGCSPISRTHTITNCDRNIIAELDNRPALDVFYEDIGEILARDPERIAGYVFAGLPIAGSDTGDYLVRNLVGIDPENKLLAVGDLLDRGQSIQFCRRDGRTAWQDLYRMLEDLQHRIERPPVGGVYYSCVGRGQHLFGSDSDELRTIRRQLGDFPLVGFFANGEISNNRLYGYTGVLSLFL